MIIVPPGRLNAVPWSLLPSLTGPAVSVAPSARTWLRASTTRSFGTNKTVLVSGPGLGAAGAEAGPAPQAPSGPAPARPAPAQAEPASPSRARSPPRCATPAPTPARPPRTTPW